MYSIVTQGPSLRRTTLYTRIHPYIPVSSRISYPKSTAVTVTYTHYLIKTTGFSRLRPKREKRGKREKNNQKSSFSTSYPAQPPPAIPTSTSSIYRCHQLHSSILQYSNPTRPQWSSHAPQLSAQSSPRLPAQPEQEPNREHGNSLVGGHMPAKHTHRRNQRVISHGKQLN